jgi:cytochrome c biogenesis protein
MKKIITSVFNYISSINLTILVLSAATVIFILQITREKLATLPAWKWLTIIPEFDFYHSKGSIILFALFCANLVACSLKRLPRTISIYRSSSRVLDDAFLSSMPDSLSFTAENSRVTKEKLLAIISSSFSTPYLVKEEGKTLYLFAEKGKYTHLGFYLAHICILFIAIGTIISTTGFQYSFDVTKGQLLDPLVVRDGARQEKALNFSLRCDDLKTVSSGESEKLKKHLSTVTILQGGTAVKTQDLDFGTHLTYNGVDIYQDRFSKTITYAKLRVNDSTGKQKEHELKLGDSFSVGDTGEKLRLTRVREDSVQLKSISSPGSIWVSKTPVQFTEPSLQAYRVSLNELLQKETTSLKAIYDPGEDLIWYSFLFMIAGFSICFFMSHQRLWVKVDMQEGSSRVVLAGAATKNQSAFTDILGNIKAALERGLNP